MLSPSRGRAHLHEALPVRVAYGGEEQAALADDLDCDAVLLHLPAWQTASVWLQTLPQVAPPRQWDFSAGREQLSASDALDEVSIWQHAAASHVKRSSFC